MSPKETMNLAQKLYEGGYITYMRTDSTVYSKEFIKKQKKFIKTKWGHQYVNEKINNLSLNKKKTNSQEAHEAIRPTNIQLTAIPNENQTRIQKLYQLIYNTTLESGMSLQNITNLSLQSLHQMNIYLFILVKHLFF